MNFSKTYDVAPNTVNILSLDNMLYQRSMTKQFKTLHSKILIIWITRKTGFVKRFENVDYHFPQKNVILSIVFPTSQKNRKFLSFQCNVQNCIQDISIRMCKIVYKIFQWESAKLYIRYFNETHSYSSLK